MPDFDEENAGNAMDVDTNGHGSVNAAPSTDQSEQIAFNHALVESKFNEEFQNFMDCMTEATRGTKSMDELRTQFAQENYNRIVQEVMHHTSVAAAHEQPQPQPQAVAEPEQPQPQVAAEPEQPVNSAAWIEKHLLYSGTDIKMYSTKRFSHYPNIAVDQSLFEQLVESNKLQEHEGIDGMKHSTIVIVKVRGTTPEDMEVQAKQIFDMHHSSSLAISFSGNVHTMELMVTIARKKSLKPFSFPADLNIIKIWSSKLSGQRGATHDRIIEAVRASLMYGGVNWRNFDFEKIKVYNLETLDAEMVGKKSSEIEDEIMRSKSITQKKRSARDAMLISVGSMLVKRRIDDERGIAALKILTTSHHYTFASFIGAADLVCQTFNILTGELETFTLRECILQGFWSDLVLVLLGDSTLGKTELLKTVCQLIASRTQKDEVDAYYILAGTVDSLRTAVSDGIIKSGVPVLFDDLTPGFKRGSRPCMSLDDIKKFCEVPTATSINARNKDIEMASDMPRVINSNAVNPNGWHKGLPADIWTVSNEQRMALDTHIKAVFKRCCFCVVTEPLYDVSVRDASRAGRRASAASLMHGLLD